MSTELQLKQVPAIVTSLISREARAHGRSINEETIVLLKEALAARAKPQSQRTDGVDEILNRFNALATVDERPMSEIIEYDELGLPK